MFLNNFLLVSISAKERGFEVAYNCSITSKTMVREMTACGAKFGGILSP